LARVFPNLSSSLMIPVWLEGTYVDGAGIVLCRMAGINVVSIALSFCSSVILDDIFASGGYTVGDVLIVVESFLSSFGLDTGLLLGGRFGGSGDCWTTRAEYAIASARDRVAAGVETYG
jgi:hypothetical protein